MNITEEKIDKFRYGSKESHIFLSLCYKSAIHFNPIMKGNFPEQDHILSKHELMEIDKNKVNSIYNIRYVTLTDNRSKSKEPFIEWMNKLGPNKERVFKAHLIPDGNWDAARFDEFLALRKKLMIEALKY